MSHLIFVLHLIIIFRQTPNKNQFFEFIILILTKLNWEENVFDENWKKGFDSNEHSKP